MTAPGFALPRPLAGRRRMMAVLLVANGFGQAVGAVATALLVQAAFDRLVSRPDDLAVGVLLAYGAGLAAAAGVVGWLRMAERTGAERLGQAYVHSVRMLLYRRLSTLPPRTLERRSQGAVMVRFIGDLSAVRQWVSRGLARLMVGGTMVSGALAALALISWPLALAVAGVLSAGAAVTLARGGALRAAAEEAQRRRGRLAANVNEKVAAIGVVQAFGQVNRERARLRRQSRRLRDAMQRRARRAGELQGLTEAVAGLASAAVLLVGAHEVSAGRASLGTVVAGMAIVGLLVAPLRDLGRVNEYWHNSRVALRPHLHVPGARRPAPRAGGRPGPRAGARPPGALGGRRGRIARGRQCRGRARPGGGRGRAERRRQVDAARRGGAPGGGRRGDRRARRPGSRRSLLELHPGAGRGGGAGPAARAREPRRNLRYRVPDAPPEELERVLRLCDPDGVLAAIPDDTRLSEGGKRLSAGQRQRVALARALVGDPPLLLLDEADANLDAGAAGVVDRVVAAHTGTVLIVTHRPERIASADVVWHLDAGRLVECGPPADLLRGDGPTARLFFRVEEAGRA